MLKIVFLRKITPSKLYQCNKKNTLLADGFVISKYYYDAIKPRTGEIPKRIHCHAKKKNNNVRPFE